MKDINWKPIDTAPHGEDIMVWNHFVGPYRTRATKLDGVPKIHWPMCFWNQEGKWYPNPSHWAPLSDFTPEDC
jgi:hypothetical protein